MKNKNKMKKNKKSGPAIFMYSVIVITAISSIVCFVLYYGNYDKNEVISISTIFFSLLWGEFWIFLITALAAMIFDSQFIIIQRYNRPRIVKLLERQSKNNNREKVNI